MENENVVNATQENVVDSPQTEVTTSTEQVNKPVTSETTEVLAEPQQEVKKPVQSAEENARFADIRRRAETEARDKMVQEMDVYWNGKKLTTYSDYMQAQNEYRQQQEMKKMVEERQIPEEVAQEIIENRKFREEYQKLQQETAKDKADREELRVFRDKYPEVDVTKLPDEVIESKLKGETLENAYVRYENKMLKEQLQKITQGQATRKTNEENASTSTGSVTGNGSAGQGYFTKEQVEAMSMTEVNKNYRAIIESQKKWK